MIELYINDLIKWNPGQEDEYTERILWIDPDNLFLFVINVEVAEGLPLEKHFNEIICALEKGQAVKLDEDPFIRIINEKDIKEKDKIIRDLAWNIISDIIDLDNEPFIYFRNRRGPLISKSAKEYDVTVTTVYKYLRRYWQRGKNKNALLPDYCNSGGKGKNKKLGEKKLDVLEKTRKLLG